MNDQFERSADYFRRLQDRICAALVEVDGTPFREDPWQYQGTDGETAKAAAAGGGRTRVLADGNVFEKAGVNFSQVTGTFPPDLAETMPGSGSAFQATGVSLVLHPRSPMVPTVHANFRYLARGNKAWFGGGADLTPYYPFRADCIHFHRVWRDVSARHAPTVDYHRMKTWCDEYFFLKHRGEARGVGGIFFDYMDHSPEAMFDFVRDAGDHFIESYVPIVQRRRDEPFSDREREFQLYRRGRYVEFNLVYDRGTVFGLKTGGRIESILMSLPPLARWVYDFRPTPGSREARLAEFLKARDWAAMDPAGDGADGLD